MVPATHRGSRIPATIDDRFEAIDRAVDGFGGLFYDEAGRATVYLKPAASPIRAADAIRAVWPEARGIGALMVREAQFGYSELADWRDQLAAVENRDGLILDDIDERLNRLTIGVESAESGQRIVGALVDRGVPREALVVEVMERARAVAQQNIDTINPTTAGIYVRGDGLGGCTLGFNVKWNGAMHFVTASHCTSTAGGTYAYPDMGVLTGVLFCQRGCSDSVTYPGFQSKLGPEVMDPAWHNTPGYWGSLCAASEICRMSDAAMIRYDYRAPTTFEAGVVGFGTLDYYGGTPTVGEIIGNNQLVGDLVMRTGINTGTDFGTISRTCIHWTLYTRPGGKTMKDICQNEMSGQAQPGDSGGPVTAYVNFTGPYLLGIVSVARIGYTGYSPINNIQTDFGPYTSWQTY